MAFLISCPILAQEDDVSWWKKLFKKESVEEIEKEKKEDPTDYIPIEIKEETSELTL